MKSQRAHSSILWLQTLGFLAIIALSWLDELASLPRRLFGGAPTAPDWHEAALETVVTLAVWAVVFTVTRRLLRRLFYVERLVRICPSCRRIGDGGDWMPLEEYFARGYDQHTAHALCLDCAHARLDASFRDA